MQPIHDRMPVIVEKEDVREGAAAHAETIAPDLMQLWAVSSAVGNVANQGEGLISPVTFSRKILIPPGCIDLHRAFIVLGV